MSATIYGIPNCNTMKKARAWLDEHGIETRFHDYKKEGIDRAKLDTWIASVGWEPLVNRSGTTFRKLADADKANLTGAKARRLMLANPSLIKRPVLERGRQVVVGFSPERYAELFG